MRLLAAHQGDGKEGEAGAWSWVRANGEADLGPVLGMRLEKDMLGCQPGIFWLSQGLQQGLGLI